MIASHYLIDIALKKDRIPSFEAYPFNLPVIRNLETLEFHPKVTYFIGENGSGKSTLLEAIAVALGFNPEGGSKHLHFGTQNTHSELHQFLRVARGARAPRDGYFLRAESFYNVATELDRLDHDPDNSNSTTPPLLKAYGGHSLHAQSHGESFLTLLTQRFSGNGLYILDEPEAALSPQRQLSVLALMHNLIGMRSQFLIATHSPILMAYPDSLIYRFGADGLEQVRYEETEHYQITREFLQHRERMLRVLFESPA